MRPVSVSPSSRFLHMSSHHFPSSLPLQKLSTSIGHPIMPPRTTRRRCLYLDQHQHHHHHHHSHHQKSPLQTPPPKKKFRTQTTTTVQRNKQPNPIPIPNHKTDFPERLTGTAGAVAAAACITLPMVRPSAAAPAATDVTGGALPMAAATCSSANLRCNS